MLVHVIGSSIVYCIIAVFVFIFNIKTCSDDTRWNRTPMSDGMVSLTRGVLWPLIILRTLFMFAFYDLPCGAWYILRNR